MPNFIALNKSIAKRESFKGLNEDKEHLHKHGEFVKNQLPRIHTL